MLTQNKFLTHLRFKPKGLRIGWTKVSTEASCSAEKVVWTCHSLKNPTSLSFVYSPFSSELYHTSLLVRAKLICNPISMCHSAFLGFSKKTRLVGIYPIATSSSVRFPLGCCEKHILKNKNSGVLKTQLWGGGSREVNIKTFVFAWKLVRASRLWVRGVLLILQLWRLCAAESVFR